MANNAQHVIPLGNRWNVKKSGAEKATKSFDNKEDALNFAREISKSQNTELYIHKQDGTVLTKESYGK